MAEKTVSVKLTARIDAYKRAMSDAKRYTTDFTNSGKNFTKIGTSMTALGTTMTRNVSLPLAALAVGATAAAVSWESAWTGVTKTVDGTATQLERLEGDLRAMALELPATHAEIAGVAEAAGQLGVGVDDIAEFTEVMISLGETTNLTADEAATALARISNIMGTSVGDVDRMASVIVDLGNNSETTEAEIVELGTRIAAAGKIAGLSEADVFAFASTLTSVGVNAEAGGTALSKTFHAINDAVIDGGDALLTFAEVAGMTTDEFAAAFQEDAAGAVAAFIEGLGRMGDAGQSTTGVLDDVGLSNERTRQALLSTAEGGDLLTESLQLGRSAWEENTAASEEAEKRYGTTGAQLEILRNKLVDLGIDIGQMLIPALMTIVDIAEEVIDMFKGLPDPVQKAILVMGGVTAVLGPMLLVVGSLIRAWGQLKLAMSGASLATLATPIGAAIAAIGVLAAAWTFAGQETKKAEESAREYADNVASMSGLMRSHGGAVEGFRVRLTDVVGGSTDVAGAMAAAGLEVDGFAETLLGLHSLEEYPDDIKRFRDELDAITSPEDFDEIWGALMDVTFEGKAAARGLEEYNAALGEVEDTSGETTETTDETVDSLADFAESADTAAIAAYDLEAATQGLLDTQQKYIDNILGSISTMFDYEKSTTALDNSYADLTDAMFENMITQGDSEKSTKEKDKAVRDLRLQELALADELYASSEAFATEKGAVLGSKEAIGLQIAELKRQRDRYPELREEIDAMIGKLEEVPGVVTTEAQMKIDDIYAKVDAAIRKINQLPSVRTLTYNFQTFGVIPSLGADGGYFSRPTNMIIGEAGDEVLLPLTDTSRMAELMSDSRVWGPMSDAISRMASPSKAPTPQVASTMGGSSGGGESFNIEVYNNRRDVTAHDLGDWVQLARLSK